MQQNQIWEWQEEICLTMTTDNKHIWFAEITIIDYNQICMQRASVRSNQNYSMASRHCSLWNSEFYNIISA